VLSRRYIAQMGRENAQKELKGETVALFTTASHAPHYIALLVYASSACQQNSA